MMEFVIVIVLILVCSMILGININYIISGAITLGYILIVFMTISFIYCMVRLVLSKRKEASFLRFDKSKKGRFQVAYYLVDGEEYPCIFPKEFVMENKLYSSDKVYNVMLDKKANRVYDRYAIATCFLGLIFGIGSFMLMKIIGF